MDNEKFETHAIVELFGHQRIAGKISEKTIGSSTWLRVDVPKTKKQPPFTRLLHPNAIYAINPTTKEVTDHMAEEIEEKPITVFDVREMLEQNKALQGKIQDHEEEEHVCKNCGEECSSLATWKYRCSLTRITWLNFKPIYYDTTGNHHNNNRILDCNGRHRCTNRGPS